MKSSWSRNPDTLSAALLRGLRLLKRVGYPPTMQMNLLTCARRSGVSASRRPAELFGRPCGRGPLLARIVIWLLLPKSRSTVPLVIMTIVSVFISYTAIGVVTMISVLYNQIASCYIATNEKIEK